MALRDVRILHLSYIFLALFCLQGCDGNNSDLKKYIQDVKTRPGRAIDPLPTMKRYEKYRYVAEQRSSPFIKVVKKVEGVGKFRPDVNRSKQPLEAYPLDSLAMVGKVKLEGLMWALIESADGRVHRIKAGQYMGKNYGKVIRISPKEMHIEERILVGDKWKKREAILQLKAGKDG